MIYTVKYKTLIIYIENSYCCPFHIFTSTLTELNMLGTKKIGAGQVWKTLIKFNRFSVKNYLRESPSDKHFNFLYSCMLITSKMKLNWGLLQLIATVYHFLPVFLNNFISTCILLRFMMYFRKRTEVRGYLMYYSGRSNSTIGFISAYFVLPDRIRK